MPEPSDDPIVISGLGAVSAAGRGVQALQQAAWKGAHLYAPIVSTHEQPGTESFSVLMAKVPPRVELEKIGEEALRALRRYDRNCAFAYSAITEAFEDAGAAIASRGLDRTGLIWGSGSSSVQMTQFALEEILLRSKRRLGPLSVAQAMVSAPCSFAALTLGLGGTSFSIGSACASGAHAISMGALLIRTGLLDCAIVGGSEQLDVYGCVAAWASSPVMSKTGCWPFLENRDGTVLGEGAGALVLQRLSRARELGSPVYAILAQTASSTGGADMVAPSEAAVRNVYSQLNLEQLRNQRVVFNPHGTATIVGDALEAKVIADTISAYGIQGRLAPTKATTGHALSASGALEAILCVLSVHHGRAPGDGSSAPLLCDLKAADAGEAFEPSFAVSNSFGFGGMNCVLVFESSRAHV